MRHNAPLFVDRVCLVVALTVAALSPVLAQTAAKDEAAIRDLITRMDSRESGHMTADAIIWFGNLPEPMVLPNQIAPRASAKISERKSTVGVSTPRCIVISQSGDLAYEFSDVKMTITMNDGSVNSFDASRLNVWQKVGGEWKVAAVFQHPHQKD